MTEAAAFPASRTVVLLALCNGAEHLAEQLDSIAKQEGGAPEVIVSDDTPFGKEDGGRAIAETEALRRQVTGAAPLTVIEGPRRGSNANFRALIRAIPDHADYAAYSDQDDIWRPYKCARAHDALSALPPGEPGVHCGRTIILGLEGYERGMSRRRPRPPSFANALVQSLAGGNTMTLNRAGIDLIRAAESDLTLAGADMVVHDWWTYQVVSGAGGRMIFDDSPLLVYRQHEHNQIGESRSFKGLVARAQRFIKGTMSEWNRENVAALTASIHRLTPQNRALLETFAKLPDMPPHRRVAEVRALGLHRQESWDTLALQVAALMGRV